VTSHSTTTIDRHRWILAFDLTGRPLDAAISYWAASTCLKTVSPQAASQEKIGRQKIVSSWLASSPIWTC